MQSLFAEELAKISGLLLPQLSITENYICENWEVGLIFSMTDVITVIILLFHRVCDHIALF